MNLRVEAGFSRPGGGLKAAATAWSSGVKPPLQTKNQSWYVIDWQTHTSFA